MLPGMLKSVTNLDEEKLGPLTEEVEGYIKEILDPTIVSRLHEEMGRNCCIFLFRRRER